MKKIFIIIICLYTTTLLQAQSTNGSLIVRSAVPFLTIAPDARSGGIGETGVATSPDNNSQYWNPAKYVFSENYSGISLSYSPWLQNLVPDMNLAYISGYFKLNKNQAFSASLRYFDLGSMDMFNESGFGEGSSNPNEFSVDMGYSRKLSENWSGAITFRFIQSDIYNGIVSADLKVGKSLAADIACYYRKALKHSTFAGGINISNVGSKISYDGGIYKDFIPANLRVGGSYFLKMSEKCDIAFSLDFNKLLVPTPEVDSTGQFKFSQQGNQDIGSIEGIFVSLADAPGGFAEELSEITTSGGIELKFNDLIDLRKHNIYHSTAFRIGYFNESENYGDRKFITLGLGGNINFFSKFGGSLDLSYIYSLKMSSPLNNTVRFTIGIDLEKPNSVD